MIKMLLVVEVEDAETESDAQDALDAYREASADRLPWAHLTIYRATHADVRGFGAIILGIPGDHDGSQMVAAQNPDE